MPSQPELPARAGVSGFGALPPDVGGGLAERIVIASGDLCAAVLTLGAALQDLRIAGVAYPLTPGGTRAADYLGAMTYFGAVVGPVANRIGGARAMIDGRIYRLPANETGNITLHGGPQGTHHRLWQIASREADAVTLTLSLPDGTDGFPGNRLLTATYRITAPAALTVTLSVRTDAPTLVNLAPHSYWNLDGGPTYAGHVLRVNADHYLPTEGRLPTGTPCPVAGRFDLRRGRTLDLSEGYDHNFCLAERPRPLCPVATLTGRSGLRLTLSTTEPGLQVYDGRGIATDPVNGTGGAAYGAHAGIALEPQHWPDAPNHPGFPPILLRPDRISTQVTRYAFSRPA